MFYFGKIQPDVEIQVALKLHDWDALATLATEIIKRGRALEKQLILPWTIEWALPQVVYEVKYSQSVYENMITLFMQALDNPENVNSQSIQVNGERMSEFIQALLSFSCEFDLSPKLLIADLNEYQAMLTFGLSRSRMEKSTAKEMIARRDEIKRVLKKLGVSVALMDDDTYGQIFRF